MPFCSQCGNEVKTPYCTSCGAKTGVIAASAPNSLKSAEDVPILRTEISTDEVDRLKAWGLPRPPKSRRFWWDYYFEGLRKYGVFSGRASRSEYWFFYLFNVIGVLGFAVFAGIIGAVFRLNNSDTNNLASLYFLATLLPYIAVSVRRLHDTGKSGWWMLVAFVPLVNLILLLFFMEDSQPGPNRFGPNPKGVNEKRGHVGPAAPTG